MKLSEISELHLAAVVAGATFLGGIGASLIGVFALDADTERQTDVQLVQLAIGILSEPLLVPEFDENGVVERIWVPVAETAHGTLRAWAVDTINAAAEVKFDDEARALLVSGDAHFRTSADWRTTIQTWAKTLAVPTDPSAAQQPEADPGQR